MTRIRLAVLASGASLFIGRAPMFAHHSFPPESFPAASFDAEFDDRQPILISGCVTKVEWSNPHTHFYLDVKDAQGKVTNWDFELASPNALMHEGWMRNSLKPGADVTVQGYRAKDGSNLVNAKTVKLSEGRQVSPP